MRNPGGEVEHTLKPGERVSAPISLWNDTRAPLVWTAQAFLGMPQTTRAYETIVRAISTSKYEVNWDILVLVGLLHMHAGHKTPF